MKRSKFFAAIIASVLVICLLAGCGDKASNGVVYEDNGEKLTLKWLGYPTNSGAQEGSVPELTLEERFNVEIEPIFYEENKYQEKKTMLMAGEDIPDLVYEMDPQHVVNDVDQDFIVEVPYEMIEKYAPKYFAYINEYAPEAWLYSRVDGKNYGLPNVNHMHMLSYTSAYRQDWLDKLGLEIPKTLDELHNVLYKFANEDPDGNGAKDTYGMTVKSGHYQHYFGEVFGAFGCLPFDWQEIDGKIVYGGLTDECKEALTVLQQWYKEGIIHPDFILGTGESEQWNSGKIGYRLSQYTNPASEASMINTVKKLNPNAKVEFGNLPVGPDGESGMRAWGRGSHVVSFGNTEGVEAKLPRMLTIIETMFTDFDLYKTLKIGKEGEQWEKAAADATSEYNFAMLPGYGGNSTDETRIAGLQARFDGPAMFTPIATSYENYFSMKTDAWKNWANKMTDEKYCLTGALNKVDIVESASDYIIDLRTKQIAVMSEIIQGIKPVDYYDEFAKIWNQGGGDVLTEEANAVKAEMDKMYKEIGIK